MIVLAVQEIKKMLPLGTIINYYHDPSSMMGKGKIIREPYIIPSRNPQGSNLVEVKIDVNWISSSPMTARDKTISAKQRRTHNKPSLSRGTVGEQLVACSVHPVTQRLLKSRYKKNQAGCGTARLTLDRCLNEKTFVTRKGRLYIVKEADIIVKQKKHTRKLYW